MYSFLCHKKVVSLLSAVRKVGLDFSDIFEDDIQRHHFVFLSIRIVMKEYA
jgi:hypothetical protein